MTEKRIETVGGYSWPYQIKDDGTAEIIGKPSPEPEGELVIPDKLGGCAVTGIGAWAFHECDDISSVAIPAGVMRIADGAFADCGELMRVAIPVGVTSIRPTALTVRVSAGDAERVRKLLADAGEDMSKLTIKEV